MSSGQAFAPTTSSPRLALKLDSTAGQSEQQRTHQLGPDQAKNDGPGHSHLILIVHSRIPLQHLWQRALSL
jgi:hypothetical protein